MYPSKIIDRNWEGSGGYKFNTFLEAFKLLAIPLWNCTHAVVT